ncbi:outer membrane protein assembly factor BamC [Sedimenticola selenatireducens]|uniref:Outer membrane protein assembly factor BamC n=1 Tax=Sedimenticola selenatireducens TaxID=191960 RepID=A0A558DN48_9GAMM|nr:outer membrane protein assembly factor BamC [Sedimenticola selenatireducens]TVO74838.1 outer membrane protein assembly factor BamC [Sedimenticola selenatireducens]TVT62373.1 MAG: outer membrane protein assembly factor BamC [Sedimenticola selenatireducens]
MALNYRNKLVSLLIASLVAGCGALPSVEDVLPDRKVEYKKAKDAGTNLEIPPDLTKSTINDQLVIPGSSRAEATTLSGQLERERIQGRVATRTGVLPKIEKIEVMRDGNQRWLRIQGSPDDVWYKTVAFWQENGILLSQQDPTVGVMVTDWLENRADIKNDFITDKIRSVFEGAYSAATRDQYRLRIEPATTDGITELYLTHRGMEEKYILDGGGDPERTVWNPRPTDHGLEAEMLRRIMNYMGVADQQSRSSLARTGAVQARSRLVRNSSEVLLLMDEELNRAWRLTGVALDRVGFAVEDRDITKRVYYVRYNDPLKETEEPGLLSKLAFWRDNDQNIDKESQYQVGLEADGRGTRVEVRNKEGVQENSETALRILTLLHEQLQ